MRRKVACIRAGDLILVVFATTLPPSANPAPIKGDDIGEYEDEVGPK
jgi:hypothetical protein